MSGVPGRPNEFYFGAVNGGVWKSVDSGRVWKPVFDDQPVASIGALAVAPSAPDVVYVGTGESTLRDSVGYGNGMYKSTDAGETWTHIGLENTQHIGRVAVHPTNPDIVFVAAIGHFYGPHPDRGVFRSKDGGRTWKKVLYKDENVGAIDVVIDPTNPKVIYAGLWNTRRPPWFVYAPTNGPGRRHLQVHRRRRHAGRSSPNGLPRKGIGRSGIAVCPSEPNRVYAVIDNLELPPGAPHPEGASRPTGRAPRGRAASSAPTTAARAGRSSPTTPGCGAAAGTSSTWWWTPTTPTASTCPTWWWPAPWTAATRGRPSAAHPAETTTTRRGSLPTSPTR